VRFVFATARKDLLRLARDWPSLLIWVGIPLIVGGLLVLMFGGDDGGPEGTVLVADQDGSIAARLLTGAFQQGPLAGMFVVESVEVDEGRERMEEGDASGLVIIPEGFGGAALEGEPATIELVTNPSQTILPGILEGTLDLTLEGAEVARRIFDDPIDRIIAIQDGEGGVADSTVAAISTRFNQAGDEARRWILPPAIELETATLGEEESFDFARAFFPGMLVLAILFMAGGLSTDVWAERRQGTLRRAVVAPTGAGAIVAGKWVAGTVALALVAAIGLAAGGLLFGLEVGSPLTAFAWLALVGAGLLAFFTTIQLLAPTETSGNVIANAITLPLAMLGGSFFPFEVMPAWMVAIGRMTPNGWALLRLREIMGGEVDGGVLLISFAAGLAIVMTLGLLAARRIRGFAT
jgi:ABC-type multidrug transport system permease subunit